MAVLRREAIVEHVPNPKIILEFGAYDGTDSVEYKKAFKNAFIYSIEPDPYMFKRLQRNIGKKEIFIFHYAVTNKVGTVDFYESKFTVSTAGMHPGEPSFAGSLGGPLKKSSPVQTFAEIPIKVPAITIKDFCHQQSITQIDFMHIDVEGSLKEVLQGFDVIRPKLIFAETGIGSSHYLNSNTQEEYHQMFYDLSYSKEKDMEENTLYLYKG